MESNLEKLFFIDVYICGLCLVVFEFVLVIGEDCVYVYLIGGGF